MKQRELEKKEARRLYIMSAKKNRKYVASTLFKDRFAAVKKPTTESMEKP